MKGDQRVLRERQARKEMNHARRQVDLFRDRLLMNGHDPAIEAAYRNAQREHQQKMQALLELTIPDMEAAK